MKFLSEEWMKAATEKLNSHGGFSGAIANVDLGIQFVVTGDEDIHYYLDIGDGTAELALGNLDDPDVTVTNDYETQVQISTGELNTQMAFMTGKLKVAGNMAKLMMHQNVFSQFTTALSGMDVEY